MLTEEDREHIDQMSLNDMEFIYRTATPMSWPWHDKDVGDYFIKVFESLGGDTT